jgi:hypothetical protein
MMRYPHPLSDPHGQLVGGHGINNMVYLKFTVSGPVACDSWYTFSEHDKKTTKFELKYTLQRCTQLTKH